MRTGKISLEKIIEVADQAYNPQEHLVLRAFKGEKVGDLLAEFIAIELKDTYDPSIARDSVADAIQTLRMARNQLENIGLQLVSKIGI